MSKKLLHMLLPALNHFHSRVGHHLLCLLPR